MTFLPMTTTETAMHNNQLALSRVTRGQQSTLSRATRQTVPPFLQKLYEMVNDPTTDDLIKWSDAGDTFLVLDHERVAHDVLPNWFKHSNFASFVRQLNMYGFHKIPQLQQGVLRSDTNTETWNFEHPNFRRNQPDQLCLITRKKQAQDKPGDELAAPERDGINTGLAAPGLNQSAIVDINSIITGLSAIKRHQAAISSELEDLRAFNQHLWQEAQEARERHQKQQDTINRILKFLAGVFGNSSTANKGSAHPSPPGVIPRKRQRLMIEGGDTEKERLLESLDGIDSPGEEETPHNRFVEVPPINSPGSTSRASSRPPPSVTTHAPEMLMNGSFPNQSAASAFSAYMPGPTLPTQYPHHDPNDSSSALMSTQTYSPKQDVLQKIANSPGALQRLMTLLQQQQQAPIPPPLDLNTPASTVPNSTGMPPVTQNPLPTSQLSQPTNASTMMSNSFGQMEFQTPNVQSLSFLQPDPIPQSTFDAYLENANTLERADTSAVDITEDIDTMQSNIESLIQKLGMDPQDFSGVNSFEAHMDGENNFMDNADEFADVLTGGSAANDPITNFDFSAFMNDYTENSNTYGTDTSGAAFNNADAASGAAGDGLDGRRSPRLSAYVDEVASQSGKSDTSSAPSVTRINIIDDTENITPKPEEQTGRRYRKRRSDVENVSVERAPPAVKKRR